MKPLQSSENQTGSNNTIRTIRLSQLGIQQLSAYRRSDRPREGCNRKRIVLKLMCRRPVGDRLADISFQLLDFGVTRTGNNYVLLKRLMLIYKFQSTWITQAFHNLRHDRTPRYACHSQEHHCKAHEKL
jgi:hypothetical protein